MLGGGGGGGYIYRDIEIYFLGGLVALLAATRRYSISIDELIELIASSVANQIATF